MTFQYHPEAAIELTQSVKYYEEKSEGLGAEFFEEVEYSIAQILTHPESGTLLTNIDRRILLNRFPFGIIYQFSENVLTIYAIMHLKRKPEYWKSRK